MIAKLARDDIEDILSLPAMQWGMLVQHLKDPTSNLYLAQLRLDLEGELDRTAFGRAWADVVAANEMLRAVFRWERLARPVQLILREHRPELRFHDLRAVPEGERDAAVDRAVAADAAESFDLTEVPFRVTLIQTGDARWTVLKTFHHILYDGWSTRVILGEFLSAYTARRRGDEPPRTSKGHYRDHVLRTRSQDEGQAGAYWKEYLADLAVRPFPDLRGQREPAARPRLLRRTLPAAAAAAVRHLAATYSLTPAQVFYVAWGLVLHKYTGANDCLFGTVVSGRDGGDPGVDAMVGLYINTPPMRLRHRPGERLGDLLRRTGAELAARDAFVSVSLPVIQQACAAPTHQPLVDTIIAVQNFPFDELLRAAPVGFRIIGHASRETTEYPLALTVSGSTQLEVEATYLADRMDEAAVEQIVAHFGRILASAGEAPDLPIADLLATRNLVGEERWRQLIHLDGAREAPVPELDVATLVERQVARTPDAIAVVYGEARLTYLELDAAANRLAGRLRARGAGPETFVGLCLAQGLARVVAMLAAVKAGAAYVPIDPCSPPTRIRTLLADATAIVLVADGAAADLADLPCPVVAVDGDDDAAPALAHRPAVHLRNPFCVVYTSGSTGAPKGVVLEHRSVVNLLAWHGTEFGLAPGRAILMLSDYTFDPHIEEIFGVLVHGATVHLAARELLLDRRQLGRYLDDHAIYLISGVPSLLRQHLHAGDRHPALAIVISGGEQLDDELKRRLLGAGYRLYNHYAPTECTVDAYSWRCDDGPVHLGQTIPNVQSYVLEGADELALDGVVGELALAGRCLARGYLGRPDLTAERFVPHPFRPGERMYRTGDLARRRYDGAVEWVGRIDGQVKLRGIRIELGEIEAALFRHPDVREAVVIARDDGLALCAYLVTARPLTGEAVRSHLAAVLPAHMIPAFLVFLDELPLTDRGKIDRARLPQPLVGATVEAAPSTPTEVRLARIWAEVLHLPPGGVDAERSFFDDGGDSLSAMSLAAAVEKELGRHLPLRDLFNGPTLRAVAALMDRRDERAIEPIPRAPEREVYPVSSIQRRIYATAARLPDSTLYNMAGGVWVDGAVDGARLAAAFETLARRHEVLRTGFEVRAGELVQRIHPHVPAPIEHHRVAPAAAAEAAHALVQPFDLARPPLARLAVIETAPDRYLLVLDVHHIIADGAACAILVRELLAAYRGEALPALPVRAVDHTVWMQSDARRPLLEAHASYWSRVLAGAPALALASDFPRVAHSRHRGATLAFELGPARRAGLAALAHAHAATLFMATLAVFGVFLARLSGRDDLVIGTPAEGRRHPDLRGVVGLLIHMLPLRLRPDPRRSTAELLDQVRAQVLEALDHQELDDAGRHPVFDVAFAYERGEDLAERRLEADALGWRLSPYAHARGSAKFDLTLTVTEEATDLRCALEYDTDLFLPETALNLRDRLCALVDAILAAPALAIVALDWRTELEKRLVHATEVEFAF